MAAIMITVAVAAIAILSVSVILLMGVVIVVVFGAVGVVAPFCFRCGSDNSEKSDKSELHVFVKIYFLYCCFL